MAFKHRMLLDPSLFLVIISFLQVLPAYTTVLPNKLGDTETSFEECTFKILSNTAFCERLGLTHVPKKLPEVVEILRIGDNSIKSLLNSSFERYTHVTYLDVSQNDIRVIETATFNPLKELALLRISWNRRMVLPSEDLLRWNTKLSYLDVSESSLKSLPGDILTWSPLLKKVFLSYNELSSVHITRCAKVRIVDLSSNNIEQLTDETFTFTCQTEELYLTGNPIRLVDPGVIASLQVRALVLGGNNLTLEVVKDIFTGVSGSTIENLAIIAAGLGSSGEIPRHLFDPLRNRTLPTLDLSRNPMILHSSMFSSLKRVSRLVLNRNYIDRIEPDFFEGMQELRVLNLDSNRIRTININGSAWKSDLVEMHLSDNYLIKISPSTFHGLRNLRLLDLTNNPALAILELTSFSGLKRIETIKLSYSNLVTFGLLTPSLRSLSLDSFGFPLILKPESSFQKLSSLEYLKITDSWVSNYNLWDWRVNVSLFDGLFNLTNLDLSKNPRMSATFKESQPRIFRSLSALQTLRLEHCNISTIHSSAFTGLESLQELNLKGNIIQQLHFDLLKGLGQVLSINLADNRIAYLDKEVFSNNQRLETLLLSNNKLTLLNQSTFKPIESSLSSIDLSLNQIICDCDLSWLLDWIGHPITLLNENTTLCSPASLKPLRNKPLLDFDPSELCSLSIPLVCLLPLAVISLVVIVVLVYQYRWQLRHRLFLLRLAAIGYMEIQDAREHDDYEFDLNIIYYDDDEEWVHEHLRIAIRERLPQYQRNVFGDEDLVLGMHYLESVDYVVRGSYKTVVLLSRVAVGDRWFMLKFRTAMDHVSDTQTEFVLVIFLEDIPDEELPFLARLYLSDGRPYLHWPDDVRGQEYFLDELTKNLTINLKTNDLIPNALYPFSRCYTTE